ncbi:histidine kinase,Response regulator receiver domain protein,histidine kinase [Rivularia sp. PCC 7116]|uniref:sensor histidine kinase n=1 Tax=Rivularia sp. PCC 7116 TaxID=373994 RepID=UPI00029F1C3C|nr:hybrid sensor histidine kinase/response regulator [Rivularia sp. PCC 7116]AFY58036.1 histidine kinase,Response regulator receiver domain protein,histidine kinase [Rivularia sp. PCC 7116]
METQENLILIVDDKIHNLEILFDVMQMNGHQVLVADSGESALDKLKIISPALILLDVMMPSMDGFEVCRQLKSDDKTKDIPVIFMTALTNTADKIKAFKLGAVDYITKPFQQEEVLARVNVQLKLRNLNQQLQKSQFQLMQAEKISALGQLVAGIAHEVKNPVSFIAGNLEHTENYTQELVDLLKLYQKHLQNTPEEITHTIDTIDLDFLLEDLPKMIASMNVGIERISDIMQSLRNFSRKDATTKKYADIHQGIDTTLMILSHRLKANEIHPRIEVIKKYGDLPEIECFPGQLNQVFMNLLANAIDVFEDKAKQNEYFIPQISISTELVNDNNAKIIIYDNGYGMSEEVQNSLFNTFFTTKPEGKGTGLGLSISYKIITETHGGTLECFSSEGKGTEFVIQIPIK